MTPPVVCYPAAKKRKAAKICKLFAEGADGVVAPDNAQELLPGQAHFFYGWTAYSVPLMSECRRRGLVWYYADNAYYFGRGTHFRVTRNALMHDGRGNAGSERFRRFKIRIKPWCDGGQHIVLTTQSELFYWARLDTRRSLWVDDVTAALRRHTDRKIVVCHKPDAGMSGNAAAAPRFEARLRNAHALVTHSSSTAVKAIIEGVPVFSLAPSMASVVGKSDLAEIEDPYFPEDREQWLWNLAANQWTYDEMEDGTCWRQLGEQQAPRFAA